jgi:hypothetical protein
MERWSVQLNYDWNEISAKPELVPRKNRSFRSFFDGCKNIISEYDQTIRRIDFDSIKNIVKDYKIKKIGLDREIEKKRVTHYTVLNMNRDNDIQSSQIGRDKFLGEHGGAIDPTVMQFDFKKKSLMGRRCSSFLRDPKAGSGVDKDKSLFPRASRPATAKVQGKYSLLKKSKSIDFTVKS